jgi:hypothetical protein
MVRLPGSPTGCLLPGSPLAVHRPGVAAGSSPGVADRVRAPEVAAGRSSSGGGRWFISRGGRQGACSRGRRWPFIVRGRPLVHLPGWPTGCVLPRSPPGVHRPGAAAGSSPGVDGGGSCSGFAAGFVFPGFPTGVHLVHCHRPLFGAGGPKRGHLFICCFQAGATDERLGGIGHFRAPERCISSIVGPGPSGAGSWSIIGAAIIGGGAGIGVGIGGPHRGRHRPRHRGRRRRPASGP